LPASIHEPAGNCKKCIAWPSERPRDQDIVDVAGALVVGLSEECEQTDGSVSLTLNETLATHLARKHALRWLHERAGTTPAQRCRMSLKLNG
jgi:hypothetical protein